MRFQSGTAVRHLKPMRIGGAHYGQLVKLEHILMNLNIEEAKPNPVNGGYANRHTSHVSSINGFSPYSGKLHRFLLAIQKYSK